MTPDDFIRSLNGRGPAPAYLFIGPETWDRERCRQSLLSTALPSGDLEEGYVRHDLEQTELAAVLDDAQSMSLFASRRVLWITSAEAALPRGRVTATVAADDDADGGGASKETGTALQAYLRNPSPDCVLVFDSYRYDFDGDDKSKMDRLRKFYSAITSQVEFPKYTVEMARRFATARAKQQGVLIRPDEVELLIEVLSSDPHRIAAELEKLALYTGGSRAVTEEDIWKLTPNAKSATIFGLVSALGRRDRAAALGALDLLVREGEYLPLALSFLATQFRLALTAREAKLTNASQVQAFFSKQGVAMWRSRAEQVAQTASVFPAPRLRQALIQLYETDKGLRDARPDDRVIMEKFVMDLTAA
jgi:DNA polymerase-3 subunit delta